MTGRARVPNVTKTSRRKTVRFDACRHDPDSPVGTCCMPRRKVLAGLGALGASALLPRFEAKAEPAAAPFRIDVHHHLTPPAYVEELAPMKRLTPQTLG